MSAENLCASISPLLPPVLACSPAPLEGVRVRTPMIYPDGDVIDVFVLKRGDRYAVTDFGDALGWLRTQATTPRRTRKQELLLQDVCRTLGVTLYHGQLTLLDVAPDTLAEAVFRLAEAVVRVSDVAYMKRNRMLQTTADHVCAWLSKREIPFERAVSRRGESGREWTVDFETRLLERTVLVFLLSTTSHRIGQRILKNVANGVRDLDHLKRGSPGTRFVALYDDVTNVWRNEDYWEISNLASVARWSRPDELAALLTVGDRGD